MKIHQNWLLALTAVTLTASLTTTAHAYRGVLDVYTCYSTNKKNAEGGTNSIRSKIISSYAIFNRANIDSQVDMRVNPLALEEVSYSVGGKTANQVLTDVANSSGFDFQGRRNIWGADLVAFIAEIPGCGIASLPGTNSVTNCLGNHTLAHEIGHNFGCGHGDGYGGGSTSYARGYTWNGTNGVRYKTILIGNYDGSATMSYRFSNPNINFAGRAAGNASNANNVRRIREYMFTQTDRKRIRVNGGAKWLIVNRNSAKVVHIPGYSTANGTNLTQWGYNGGAHMQWQFKDAPGGGTWSNISNVHSGKFMDSGNNPTNGTNVRQWSDYNSNDNQKFNLDFGGDGYVRLRCSNGNGVLHNHGNTSNDGARVTLWQNNGANHLKYEIRYITP